MQRLGAIVTKTTTLPPRRGNPPQRIAETPGGMLNSIGLQNIGIANLVRDLAPVYATWRAPVIASIMGFTAGEYAEVAARLEGVEGFAGIELNLSCPNTERGGIEFGQDPAVRRRRRATRRTRACSLPVIAKLTPNVADPRVVARAVVEAGANALCCGNTLLAMAIDLDRRRPLIGATSSPGSPAPRSSRWRCARSTRSPAPSTCRSSAAAASRPPTTRLEFIFAGASAVQVGTATFANPLAPIEVLEGIERYCREHGVEDISW